MATERATRRDCHHNRVNCVAETRSIVPNLAAFRMTMWTLAFVASCVAVPTVMAVLKQIGAW